MHVWWKYLISCQHGHKDANKVIEPLTDQADVWDDHRVGPSPQIRTFHYYHFMVDTNNVY